VPPLRNQATEIETLYRKHGSALLLFAIAIAGERSRAQDAVHQVFLKMIESGMLARAADAKAYLFASVRNALLNDAKGRQRHVQLENIPLEDAAIWFSPPDRDYAAELSLRRALAAIPEDQRAVTILHIWGELTFAQIAEVLDISSNTAASRYRYALARLRQAMITKEGFCGTF
jgi:RNA polymerase sigma-70 factor (ECF subfamily)